MKEYSIDDVSLGMALLDYAPVLLFAGCIVAIFVRHGGLVLLMGGLLCTLAGLSKASWKLVMAKKNKNIFFLNYIFRIFMITGFSLIIIYIILKWNSIISGSLNGLIFKMPQAVFYVITMIGMISMCVCAIKQDHTKSSSNWMEEIINAISQGSLFIGIMISCGYLG
jgi:hypothetical protein